MRPTDCRSYSQTVQTTMDHINFQKNSFHLCFWVHCLGSHWPFMEMEVTSGIGCMSRIMQWCSHPAERSDWRSYNVGGGNEQTNLEIVSKLCLILDRLKPSERGPYSDLITFVKDRPGHDQRYAIDPSRLENELSWRPTFTIDAGLEHTITWYLENGDWWRPLVARPDFGERLGIYLW